MFKLKLLFILFILLILAVSDSLQASVSDKKTITILINYI